MRPDKRSIFFAVLAAALCSGSAATVGAESAPMPPDAERAVQESLELRKRVNGADLGGVDLHRILRRVRKLAAGVKSTITMERSITALEEQCERLEDRWHVTTRIAAEGPRTEASLLPFERRMEQLFRLVGKLRDADALERVRVADEIIRLVGEDRRSLRRRQILEAPPTRRTLRRGPPAESSRQEGAE